jgi:hypothetical protein
MKDQCRRCGETRYVDPPLRFTPRRVTCVCLSEQWYDWCACKGGIVDSGACFRCAKDAQGSLRNVDHIGRVSFDNQMIRVAGKPVLTYVNLSAELHMPQLAVCTQILLRVDALEKRLSNMDAKLDTLCAQLQRLFEVAEFLPGAGTEYQETAEKTQVGKK